MPYIGLNKETNKRVNILRVSDPRAEFVKGQIICPYCSEEMAIRGSKYHKPQIHFMHLSDQCKSGYESHPESPEHLFFKEYLAENLSKEFEDYQTANVELEYPISNLKRIIDVAFTFPNGWVVAHEVQLSAISVEELAARTKDYQNEGIDVIWWLGKSADTKPNRQWCREVLGSCYTINYELLEQVTEEAGII